MSDDLDGAVGALNDAIAKIRAATIEGLLAAGKIIEDGARDLVPEHSGELKDSSYTRISDSDPNVVEVGFEAPYAAIINDDDDMKLAGQPRSDGNGTYWGPHGTADFLQKSVEANKERALQAIADKAST